MNNVFERNIQALAVKDKELADRIINHVITDVPQLLNKSGFYNLLYKNIPLHNPINPLAEAKEIFSMAENTPVSIHLVYGIGLGYLFQIASANSNGTVILYEPDLNILKTAFSLVDFSKDIVKKNVFIADNINLTGEYLYRKSNTNNTPLLLTNKSYRDLDGEKFNDLVEELQRMIGSYNLDRKYTQENFYPLVKNIINNIPVLINEIPLFYIKDCYKGETAVVVSAGPTLDRNIETIKKYRNNIVLIVVGTAMRTLAKHNITPDFLCIIESFDSSKQIEGLDLSSVNFVTEPYSNSNVRKYKFKQIYSHISNNMPINAFWSKLINENNDEYLSKGTVSYTALNTARILGCSKIVLVGQDLAYIEGQCYSKDSAYKDLEIKNVNGHYEIMAKDMIAFANALSNAPDQETRLKVAVNRLQRLNKSLYYVKGINGDRIPTESVYAAFIKPLTEFTSLYNDRTYVNTSMVGAQIDGFENMPLTVALENSKPIENRCIDNSYNFDRNTLMDNLSSEINLLENIKNDLNQGQKALKTLNTELKRFRCVNVDVLKDLRKVSSIFLNITTTATNTLFDYISSAERIDMDYVLKTSTEFNLETLQNMQNKFSTYFNSSEHKIDEIQNLLKKTQEILK